MARHLALFLLARSAAGAWRPVADLPFGLSDFTATVVPNFGEVEGRGRIVIVCVESNVRRLTPSTRSRMS